MKREPIDRIIKFSEDHEWDQFRSPANLAKLIVIEAAELLECFRGDNDEFEERQVKAKLADVMVCCQNILDKLALDADEIINEKMDKTEAKYPVEKAKGDSAKYNMLG